MKFANTKTDWKPVLIPQAELDDSERTEFYDNHAVDYDADYQVYSYRCGYLSIWMAQVKMPQMAKEVKMAHFQY